MISITLWQTEADREAGVGSGSLQAQIAKGAHLFAAPTRIESYEASIQLEMTVMADILMEMPESESNEEKDSFLFFGKGVVA